LTYQTAFVDDAGKLQTRRDLYNLDPRTLNAIKNARAIANPASEPKSEPAVAAPAPAPVQRRKVVQRVEQPAASPSIFSFPTSAPRSARPQPVRGASSR
jgi:hypothetical protein